MAVVNGYGFEQVARLAAGRRATLGMDVGKYEILGVLRWADGQFERPWKVKNPAEIRFFSEQLRLLAGSGELGEAPALAEI